MGFPRVEPGIRPGAATQARRATEKDPEEFQSPTTCIVECYMLSVEILDYLGWLPAAPMTSSRGRMTHLSDGEAGEG